MNQITNHDAGTILFNLLALPTKNQERKEYLIALLKRRFYEWERLMISAQLLEPWKGIHHEVVRPREWTSALFEVFWFELIRTLPCMNPSQFPWDATNEIRTLLLKSIFRED